MRPWAGVRQDGLVGTRRLRPHVPGGTGAGREQAGALFERAARSRRVCFHMGHRYGKEVHRARTRNISGRREICAPGFRATTQGRCTPGPMEARVWQSDRSEMMTIRIRRTRHVEENLA
jgi:hypothetical protein